jgi:hypothetical protein
MSLIDFGRWGFFVPITIGEIYGTHRFDSLGIRSCLLLRPVAAQVQELKTLTVATHIQTVNRRTNMKDRSFIHRTAQSREAKADNLRRFGPAPVIDQFPAQQLGFWATIVAAFRTFIKWVRG